MRSLFYVVICSLILFGATFAESNLVLTNDGKVSGNPLQELQQQIDQLTIQLNNLQTIVDSGTTGTNGRVEIIPKVVDANGKILGDPTPNGSIRINYLGQDYYITFSDNRIKEDNIFYDDYDCNGTAYYIGSIYEPQRLGVPDTFVNQDILYEIDVSTIEPRGDKYFYRSMMTSYRCVSLPNDESYFGLSGVFHYRIIGIFDLSTEFQTPYKFSYGFKE